MKYYNLKCEVPGGIGPQTVFDKSVTPWTIKNLHLVLEGWLGGSILAVSSCLIVTKSLQETLSFNYSGILSYENFYLEESENFKILQPDLLLPEFSRIIVGSKGFIEDFALMYHNNLFNQLIISEKAKEVLSKFNLGNYFIEEAIR